MALNGCTASRLPVLFAALLVMGAVPAHSVPSPAPSPRVREALDQAWWTGPLLAPSGNTLPRGHALIEPYLYDVISYGIYNGSGALKPVPHANGFGSLTYIIYGVTDRFNAGVIPTFGYTVPSGSANSTSLGFGDWAIFAQYRFTQYRLGSWFPMMSLNVQETMPTGAYDRLGDSPNDGFGGGVYSTKLSLYTQTYFWMTNGRILRARLNFSDTIASSAPVNGVSVYGTPQAFSGSVHPGNAVTIDAASEYSITRNWVVASDLVYAYSADTRLSAARSVIDLGDSHSIAIAPALEYNWSPNVGVIAGFRLFPAGVNTGATLTPAIALNYVH